MGVVSATPLMARCLLGSSISLVMINGGGGSVLVRSIFAQSGQMSQRKVIAKQRHLPERGRIENNAKC